MSRFGIDVSSYQNKVDWKKVKAAGYEFALLKIIMKDLSKDKKFEENWKGCEAAGVDIYGVYNYSYATTVAKAKADAKAVINALAGRKTIVWIDVEDNCQKNLKQLLIDIILAYKAEIEKSGNRFGIYTGQSFYNNYLKPYIDQLSGIKFWIARYGQNNGKKNISYQPQIKDMVLWQYSSKASVPGVGSASCDVNCSYNDEWFKKKETPASNASKNPYKEPTRVLKYKTPNMSGDDVKWVQYYLVEKGMLAAKTSKGASNIDGIFGKGTKEAVIKFQKSVKITADGIVGQDTKKYLKQ